LHLFVSLSAEQCCLYFDIVFTWRLFEKFGDQKPRIPAFEVNCCPSELIDRRIAIFSRNILIIDGVRLVQKDGGGWIFFLLPLC